MKRCEFLATSASTVAAAALWCDPDNQGKTVETIYGDDATFRYPIYRQVYQDRVAAYDRSLGAVLDALRTHGLYDHSLIVATSDPAHAATLEALRNRLLAWSEAWPGQT